MPNRFLQVRWLLLLAAISALYAQPVVAPTPERPVTARGEDVGNYNITNSFGNQGNAEAVQSYVPRDFRRYGGVRASYNF